MQKMTVTMSQCPFPLHHFSPTYAPCPNSPMMHHWSQLYADLCRLRSLAQSGFPLGITLLPGAPHCPQPHVLYAIPIHTPRSTWAHSDTIMLDAGPSQPHSNFQASHTCRPCICLLAFSHLALLVSHSTNLSFYPIIFMVSQVQVDIAGNTS